MLSEVVHFSRRYEDIESELEPVRLADTLVVFGKTRLTDKHRIELDDTSRYAAFAAYRLIDAEAAKRIEYRSTSAEGLLLLESYFDMLPTPEESVSGGIVSGVEDEIKELKKIALNKEFGSVALVTAGPVDKIITDGLKSKGINTESFSPEDAINKRFVASSTNSPKRIAETAWLFIKALTSKLPDIRFIKLTPVHPRV